MDGVATPIIGRPRPLPGHDTPNPAYHPHTLNYEEPKKLLIIIRRVLINLLGKISWLIIFSVMQVPIIKMVATLYCQR